MSVSPGNQRLLGAVLLGVLFLLDDPVLPELVERGWTLVIFAAIPLSGRPAVPGACRARAGAALRRAGSGALVRHRVWDIGRMADPPLPALVPLTAIGLAMWSSISVQAYAARKRGRMAGGS